MQLTGQNDKRRIEELMQLTGQHDKRRIDSDNSLANENSKSSGTDRSGNNSDDDGGEIGRIWYDRLRNINTRPFQEPITT